MSFNPDPKNWTLNTYTVSTWTDLVNASASPVVLKAVTVAVGSSAANVKVRVADAGGASRAVIVPSSTLAATSGYSLDVSAVTLGTGDKLQVQADVAGCEFAAFGGQ